ncbi:MAG: ATP-grasp domain-containing protein [Verrucomicrobia bacterium]|nr:ATP-grasp domain-containing protein [Verrucomicrobiota bacterium]
MKELIIGVSGINAIDNPGPGIGVARSLKEDGELKVKIVGLAYDAMEPGIFMDWVVDKSYIMPYPSGCGDAFIERLLYIKESHGLDCVIPNLDAELPLYIKNAEVLAGHGIHTFLPGMEQFKLRSKDRLAEIAGRMGISLPRTKVVHSVDTLMEAIEELELPVMVKGSFYKAYKCHTVGEAVAHYHQLVAEWGYPIIVQQVVSGDEMNVVGLGDGEGNSLGSVGIKKLSVTALGKIWTGVTVKHRKMMAAVDDFVREFKWRGPFELECMVSGDEVYLIEINPRFPAWSYFATGVGVNLPSRLVRRSFGLPVAPVPDYAAGKLFIRYTDELVTDMDKFQKAITRGET